MRLEQATLSLKHLVHHVGLRVFCEMLLLLLIFMNRLIMFNPRPYGIIRPDLQLGLRLECSLYWPEV